jgi:hypothetical protein
MKCAHAALYRVDMAARHGTVVVDSDEGGWTAEVAAHIECMLNTWR